MSDNENGRSVGEEVRLAPTGAAASEVTTVLVSGVTVDDVADTTTIDAHSAEIVPLPDEPVAQMNTEAVRHAETQTPTFRADEVATRGTHAIHHRYGHLAHPHDPAVHTPDLDQ